MSELWKVRKRELYRMTSSHRQMSTQRNHTLKRKVNKHYLSMQFPEPLPSYLSLYLMLTAPNILNKKLKGAESSAGVKVHAADPSSISCTTWSLVHPWCNPRAL